MTASKYKIWVAGEEALASEMNETVLQPFSNMDATDNTTQELSSTNSAGETVGYNTVRTLGIAANQISNFIIIRADLFATANDTGTYHGVSATAYIQFTIDSTQKFEKSISGSVEGNSSVVCYKYSPSASEKTNGFVIDLDLKLVRNATPGSSEAAYARNGYWEVWGC